MNTLEICTALYENAVTRESFGNVCAYDELPLHQWTTPRYWVINTAPSWHSGKHWVVIYISQARNAEFFDTLGRRPEYYNQHLHDFISKYSMDYVHNGRRLQGRSDSSCGLHCIYYIYHRCLGNSMDAIVNNFTDDPHFNNTLVESFMTLYTLH